MFSQDVIGAFGEELGGQPRPHPYGVGERSGAGQPDGVCAIRAEHGTAQIEFPGAVSVFTDVRQGRDRSTATGLQGGEQ